MRPAVAGVNRLGTLFGGLLALLILSLLLLPDPPRATATSLPASIDRGAYGLAGLQRWAERGGVPTRALRRRYGSLEELPGRVPAGNLLLVSLPQLRPATPTEREALRAWVQDGNTVLFLWSVEDGPAALRGALDEAERGLLAAFGLEPATLRQPPGPPGPQRGGSTPAESLALLVPADGHPLLDGVERVAVQRVARPAPTRELRSPASTPPASVLREAPGGPAAFWQSEHGNGRVWFSRYGDLFGNDRLGLADNARFLANLVRAALGPGGHLIFDDFHLGLSDLYDPQTFYADPRLHRTLAFLLGLWILYVLGHAGPPGRRPDPTPATRGIDRVRVAGRFFARRVPPHQVALGLYRHFFNGLRARHGLPTDGRPAWELLAADGPVEPELLRRLQADFRRAELGLRVDPGELAGRLTRLRNRRSADRNAPSPRRTPA